VTSTTTDRQDRATGGSIPNRARELPPDPEAYDDPRAVIARAKGLDAPYIPGGLDPDPEKTSREERRLIRLLIAMVIVVVLGGFVFGALGMLITGTG
jgi:hypothetical protein